MRTVHFPKRDRIVLVKNNKFIIPSKRRSTWKTVIVYPLGIITNGILSHVITFRKYYWYISFVYTSFISFIQTQFKYCACYRLTCMQNYYCKRKYNLNANGIFHVNKYICQFSSISTIIYSYTSINNNIYILYRYIG